MEIAVIGAGHIGGTLARKWAKKGHRVTLGLRDPQKGEIEQLITELGSDARAASVSDAVRGGEAVVFAIPGRSMSGVVTSIGDALNGKVVIDATNNIGGGSVNSVATLTAAAPGAHVYRAFNIYGWENLETPDFDGTPADLFFAGPDGDPRSVAEQLISDVGLRPIWLGGVDKAGLVDSLLALWFTLSSERGLGRHLALKLLSR